MLKSKTFGIDKGPFLKLSVGEYLWGYSSLILSIAENQACESSRVEEFQERGFEEDWDDWEDEVEPSTTPGNNTILIVLFPPRFIHIYVFSQFKLIWNKFIYSLTVLRKNAVVFLKSLKFEEAPLTFKKIIIFSGIFAL